MEHVGMSKHRAWAAAALAAAWLAGGAAARAERPRISVAPVAGDHATPEIKQRVGESLAEGLIASGADVAPTAAEAPYILRGTVEVDGRSYTLHLEMLDRRTGALVASREDRCEICTEAEAFETANTAASTLKALVFKRQGGAAAPRTASASAAAGGEAAGAAPVAGASAPTSDATAAAPAAAPAPALAATPPGGAATTSAAGPTVSLETQPASRAPHRALGWGALAGGVVSAGVGGFLLSIDGHGTCDGSGGAACRDLYQTRWPGIGLVTLGVAAAAAGVLAILGKL
jgi:hypothetical protein